MVYGLVHSFGDSLLGNMTKLEKASKRAGRKLKKKKAQLAKPINRNRRVIARLPNNHVSNSGSARHPNSYNMSYI